jgi:crotonobetainyl-CoA:carnitine CoA-transferase CaiB-like acyl-CoA transferase
VTASARPLEGIRVLDLSRLLPGPFLTMILADLGADVVKIEDPRGGDYMRVMPPAKGGLSGRFLAVNRNKRSVALDLKTDAGRAAMHKMARTADVVVETFRPGVLDRLGVGYDALRAINPRIILCSVSGYGQTGPYRLRAGHDLNYIALAGMLAMGGEHNGAPFVPGIQIADFGGGALWGATSVLAALFGRERSGEGAHLDVAMCEGSLALMSSELGNMDAGGPPATRGTGSLNGGLACYGVYRTADDKYMSVGSLEPKFWLALNAALGRPGDLAELMAPLERQHEIRDEIAAIFATRTRDEWTDVFSQHDCCVEPVLELTEVADHPQHAERGMFFAIDGGELGPMVGVRTPLGTPRVDRIAPQLGEHTAEVLREYGLSDAEIDALT